MSNSAHHLTTKGVAIEEPRAQSKRQAVEEGPTLLAGVQDGAAALENSLAAP